MENLTSIGEKGEERGGEERKKKEGLKRKATY
jgi:hypothetical protein